MLTSLLALGGHGTLRRMVRRWRYYRTSTGTSPVQDALNELDFEDGKAIRAAMNAVRRGGLVIARHIKGDIYEVRAARAGRAWRVLFTTEGRAGQVLLALSTFEKKTAKTPHAEIDLAQRRLRDWRNRARR